MNRDFFLLWQGQLVSQLGNQVYVIALAFWVMDATDSASLIGLLMGLVSLPALVMGPIGGTFADRHSRKVIIVAADLVNGLVVLALSAAFFWWPGDVTLLVVLLAAATLASGVAQAFFRPAVSAAIADIVPMDRLARANSLLQGSAAMALIVGQALGGVLYTALGIALLFAINGATFLFSAASESLIRLSQPYPEGAATTPTFRSYARETGEGFRYVWNRRGLRQLTITFGAMVFFGGPVMVMFPFYVKHALGRGADWYGFLLAATGAGAVLGFIVAGRIRLTGRVASSVLLSSLLGVCLTVAFVGQVDTPLPALLLFYILGALVAMTQVFVRTLVQGTTPSRVRGRTISLVNTISAGLAPLGMALGGVLADFTGRNVPLIYGISGAASAVTVLVAASRPDFRAFLSSFPTADPLGGNGSVGERKEPR